MAAAVVAFLPVITMLPGLIKDVAEIITILKTPDLTEAERAARLDALAERLDARVAEVEEMALPERQTEDGEGGGGVGPA